MPELTDAEIAELERLEREATRGPWESVDEKREHHHFKFLRAPECIVPNNRGPSYALEILSDEDYDTKSADLKFIAALRNHADALIAAAKAQRGDGWRTMDSAPKDGPKSSPEIHSDSELALIRQQLTVANEAAEKAWKADGLTVDSAVEEARRKAKD